MSSLQTQLKTAFSDYSNQTRHRSTNPTLKPPRLKKVSEADYWDEYYTQEEDEFGNPVNYEWNNGYLEIKPVSDYATSLLHVWFLSLLHQYLQHKPCAKLTLFEMGAKFNLPVNEAVIRKPDMGVVLNSNPVHLTMDDARYHGQYDMCIEVVSTSRRSEIERDTIQKKREYQLAGVQEYLVLAREAKYCAYYHLNATGVYDDILADDAGVLRSTVLPEFQWREDDLWLQPSVEEMITLPVYQGFVSLQHQKVAQKLEQTKQKIKQAEQKAEQAEQKTKQTEQRYQQELLVRLKMQRELAALKAQLAQ